MMRELLNLFKITGRGARYFSLLLLRCPFDALQTVIQASFLQFSFLAINQKSASNLHIVCAAFGIGSLLLFLYNGTVWTVYASYIIRLISVLRGKLFGHVSGISLQQIEAKSSGEWFTRLNADVQSTSAMLSQPIHLPHAVVSIVGICVSATILFAMNPAIFALVILFLIPHMLISQLFIAKPMTALATKSQETTAQNTTDMNALVTCADTAILYEAQDFMLNRFEESSLNLRKVNMKIRKRSAAGGALLPMMGMSGYLTILLIGGIWISAGNMTFGELMAAFQYRGGVLVGSIMLINSLISIRIALAGVRRINETMHIQSEE
ncbi:MAG: ABC transporter ATP-binding protein [Clostridiales bacterium]|nr:ABC transporter ATP-binding protein [Clostridiales bacterium]